MPPPLNLNAARWMAAIFLAGAFPGSTAALPPADANAPAPEPLAWDAVSKEVTLKTNEISASVTFSVTNISPAAVTIDSLRPSCGCTVAQMPAKPWRLAPGEWGRIQVTSDLRGKHGTVNKFVLVESSAGFKLLRTRITIPPSADRSAAADQRAADQQTAAMDRQAVFQGDCARCHVPPAAEQNGAALYEAACGICHEVPNRATMVPDLSTVTAPATARREYWRRWTAAGRAGTLMPAFSRSASGPLTDKQIGALADYLVTRFGPAAPKPARPSSLPGRK